MKETKKERNKGRNNRGSNRREEERNKEREKQRKREAKEERELERRREIVRGRAGISIPPVFVTCPVHALDSIACYHSRNRTCLLPHVFVYFP